MMAETETRTQPAAGELWQHYKGGKYRIVCIAHQEDGKRYQVVYRSTLFPENIWCRPLKDFMGNVRKANKSIPRYVKVDE